MNVICYKRVSTDEQRNFGYSLQQQEIVLKNYCDINHYDILETFTEDYSAKSFENRPEWKKIMSYIRKNRKKVDLILCVRWDRFSRNISEALNVIKTLRGLGIGVNTVEQPLDFSNPDNKILLTTYLTLPEIENDKNSQRTKDGMHRARMSGCWTGSTPRGFKPVRLDTNSTLTPSDEAPLIKEAFERMGSGSYSAEEVRRFLKTKGIKLTKQAFLNLIRNTVYIGKIKVQQYKNDKEQLVNGLHPAIISEQLFYTAQDILNGRKRNMKFGDAKTDLYPLKGLLQCPIHKTSLTAYGALSRNKQIYHYYLCPKCGREQRHPIKSVHNHIEEILSTIQFTAQTLELYKRILEKLFDKQDVIRKGEILQIQKELAVLSKRKTNLQDKYLDNEINSIDFNEMVEKLNIDIARLQNHLDGLQQELTPYKKYINHTIPMLQNLVEYYRQANGVTKKKILCCIFDGKLILQKGRVAALPFSIPVQVLFKITKELQNSDKKKEVNFDLLSNLAPPAGLEPATL